jgi:hypothetical protein
MAFEPHPFHGPLANVYGPLSSGGTDAEEGYIDRNGKRVWPRVKGK